VTFWRNCFTSAALALSIACARAPVRPQPPPAGTVLVLPPVNLSGTQAPLREIRSAVEQALRTHGVATVDAGEAEAFLARHRIRWTGGVDRESARAAGEELGVEGVLVTSVELYSAGFPPRAGFIMRLVSAGADARVRWIDEAARTGDDAPGLFELGIVRDPFSLRADVLSRLASSLAAYLSGAGPRAVQCPADGRFGPRVTFHAPLDPSRTWTVAVLPFINETQRRGAGELVALQFVRQLEASGRFRAVEPGVLREELLRFRIVLLELVQADLIVAGYGREDDDTPGSVPRVQFTALMLDRKNNEVVGEITSYGAGDDGVFFFDAGLVRTAPELSCRMVRAAIESAKP